MAKKKYHCWTIRRTSAVINSSLAGVYKNAIETWLTKCIRILHGIQGCWMSSIMTYLHRSNSELDIELLKRTPHQHFRFLSL